MNDWKTRTLKELSGLDRDAAPPALAAAIELSECTLQLADLAQQATALYTASLLRTATDVEVALHAELFERMQPLAARADELVERWRKEWLAQ